MSIAAKDRFIAVDLKIPVGRLAAFPPTELNYKGIKLVNLGISNKEDLIPINFDTIELQRVIVYGVMKQFIYAADNGDLYEVCIYKDERGDVYIYGVRTRQMPEEEKKKKGGEVEE